MPSTTKEPVGAEINSVCTKCRVETVHTISSKVGDQLGKVKCKTCGSLHRYLPPGSTVAAPRRKSLKVTPEETWTRCMQGVSTKNKRKTTYTPSGAYQIDDVIDHSHFGLGVVTLLTAKDKIQVTFKDGPRILIMGMRQAV